MLIKKVWIKYYVLVLKKNKRSNGAQYEETPPLFGLLLLLLSATLVSEGLSSSSGSRPRTPRRMNSFNKIVSTKVATSVLNFSEHLSLLSSPSLTLIPPHQRCHWSSVSISITRLQHIVSTAEEMPIREVFKILWNSKPTTRISLKSCDTRNSVNGWVLGFYFVTLGGLLML